MFGFRKKQKEIEQAPEFYIKFNIGEDGKANASVAWPIPFNDEEEVSFINLMTALVLLLNEGKLLPHIQGAIAEAGKIDDKAKQMSRSMLYLINQHLGKKSKKDENKVVVPPVEVFGLEEEDD